MAAPAAKRFAGDLAALPEDVLLEIFSRVRSVKDLFLLAVTSTWWLRRFTDPAFLRGLLPAQGQGHGARLLGFFFQQTTFVRCERMMKARTTQRASAYAPTFFPTPWSLLGPTERALTSFVADDGGDFNYAVPLAARCGIVLMDLIPRTSDLDELFDSGRLFGLCNPGTGERHVLPPVDCVNCKRKYMPGFAIITAADSSDLDGDDHRLPLSRRHEFSQLLLISHHEDGNAHLNSYSASTRRWSTPTTWCQTPRGMTVSYAATVHRGLAHWLYTTAEEELYTLTAEVATTHVSFTKVPVTAGRAPFLCINREGRLSITSVFGMHVQVWTRQDGEPASWLRTRLIAIPIATPTQHPYAMIRHQEWYEFNGGVMFTYFDGGDVFVLDLEKKVIEKIMVFPPCLLDKRCEMIIPYEMDLSEFFVSQLGGLLARGKSQIDAVKDNK